MNRQSYVTCLLNIIYIASLPFYNGFVIPTAVRRSPFVRNQILMTKTTSTTDDEIPSIFSTYSNEEGLMTKETLVKIPSIAELVVRLAIFERFAKLSALDDIKCSRITPPIMQDTFTRFRG